MISRGIEEAQVINYLKATGVEAGFLISFGCPLTRYQRLGLAGATLRNLGESVDL